MKKTTQCHIGVRNNEPILSVHQRAARWLVCSRELPRFVILRRILD